MQVVRPLLSFHKAELEQYCRASGLRFVLDPTNSHLAYHRNRIRHALHEYPHSPALSGGDAVGEAGPSFTHGRGDSQAAVQWGAPMASLPTTLSEEVQEGDSKASRSSSSASRSSSNSDSSHGSGHSQSIVSDLLMLQRRCQAYAAQEQKDTQRLLQRAVLRSSCSQLQQQQQQQSMQDEDFAQHPQALQQAQRERPVARFKRERGLDHLARQQVWAQSRPWFIDWHVRLDQVRAQQGSRASRPAGAAGLQASVLRGRIAACLLPCRCGASGGCDVGHFTSLHLHSTAASRRWHTCCSRCPLRCWLPATLAGSVRRIRTKWH